jgi:hypothetical protein
VYLVGIYILEYRYSSCCEVQVVTVAYTVAIDWLNEIPFIA